MAKNRLKQKKRKSQSALRTAPKSGKNLLPAILLTGLPAVILPLLVFLTGFASVNNAEFLSEFVQKHNPEAVPATMQLVGYFNSRAEMPVVFNAKESVHLQDVKKVINELAVFYFALLGLFVLLMFFADMRKVFFWGSIFSLALAVLLAVIPFAVSFSAMHTAFFEKGTYVFPAGSVLIQYYPVEFFRDISKAVWLRSALLSSALLFFSFTRNKYIFNNNKT